MSDGAPSSRTHPRRQGPDGGVLSVFVADEQTEHDVDIDRWVHLAEQVLRDEGVTGEAELSVLFVDEAHMAELNTRFMGHEGSTDVLSFPLDAADDGLDDPVLEVVPASGTGPLDRGAMDPDDQPLLLGDVVICPAVAARQAPTHAGSYDDEVALLLVHGILHVLGMDHAADAELAVMQQRERELLGAFHGPLGGDPWAS